MLRGVERSERKDGGALTELGVPASSLRVIPTMGLKTGGRESAGIAERESPGAVCLATRSIEGVRQGGRPAGLGNLEDRSAKSVVVGGTCSM